MKVFQLQDDWSVENLVISERREPQVGPGQIKLRMKAASLNYRDMLVMQRGYGALTGSLPLIPISDGVGEVVEIGEGVTRVEKGNRVCPMIHPHWICGPPTKKRLGDLLGGPQDGVMAEFMVVNEKSVVRIPSYLTNEEAATLPCAALTAWTAIVAEAKIHAGDTVLVQGTGGVALFSLQIAKLIGAKVIIISSSDEKLEKSYQMGADEGINYRKKPEWGKIARDLAGGEGVDHIVELGGNQTLPQSLRAIRPGGSISLIGVLSGGNMDVRLGLIVTRYVRLQGITVGNRDGFEKMSRAFDQQKLKPVVDRIFSFDQLREALDYLGSGSHFGKICIRH
jgi:NADPH:quinone reductase-like Zn-dependent oxidoreductase